MSIGQNVLGTAPAMSSCPKPNLPRYRSSDTSWKRYRTIRVSFDAGWWKLVWSRRSEVANECRFQGDTRRARVLAVKIFILSILISNESTLLLYIGEVHYALRRLSDVVPSRFMNLACISTLTPLALEALALGLSGCRCRCVTHAFQTRQYRAWRRGVGGVSSWAIVSAEGRAEEQKEYGQPLMPAHALSKDAFRMTLLNAV